MKKIILEKKIGKFIVIDRKVIVQNKSLTTKLLCKCTKCGKEHWYNQNYVKKAKCCEGSKGGRKETEYKENTVINNIILIEKTDKFNKSRERIWKCKCYCGNIFYSIPNRIKRGNTKSCGCCRSSNKEIRREIIKKAQDRYKDFSVEGTNLLNLTNKLSIRNTSGHKGVYWSQRDKKWKAQIKFKQKLYALGRFDDFEEAVKAREKAEEKFFKPVLGKYKNLIEGNYYE